MAPREGRASRRDRTRAVLANGSRRELACIWAHAPRIPMASIWLVRHAPAPELAHRIEVARCGAQIKY